jgi:hypothetical protein
MYFAKWPVVLAIIAGSKALEVPPWMEDMNDWRNTLGCDATADDYRERGLELPPVAKPVTTIDKGQSYVAKLGCLGCPSRNRLLPEDDGKERWEDVVQETSLASPHPFQHIFLYANTIAATEFYCGRS